MFLKKHFTIIGLACVLSVPAVDAGAEGFAINEWSAEGVAMGGARMFAENDAANIAYNPASITKVRGEAFKQSAVYISPHGKYTAYDATGKPIDEGKNVVHAGWAPGNYYVKQLNDKDWIGIGLFSRFGMISEFERDSKVASNAFFSRLNGASLTPTYARKFDNKWSAAVGRKSIMWVWNCKKMFFIIRSLPKPKEKAGPWAGMRLPIMLLILKMRSAWFTAAK